MSKLTRGAGNASCEGLEEGIRKLKEQFESCSFSFTPRESNPRVPLQPPLLSGISQAVFSQPLSCWGSPGWMAVLVAVPVPCQWLSPPRCALGTRLEGGTGGAQRVGGRRRGCPSWAGGHSAHAGNPSAAGISQRQKEYLREDLSNQLDGGSWSHFLRETRHRLTGLIR